MPGRAGVSAGLPVDGRSDGDQQGRGGSDNLAELEMRLAARKAPARPTDGRSQDDVVRQTGVGELSVEGAGVSREAVSDKELARYLSSIGGGFESHGVLRSAEYTVDVPPHTAKQVNQRVARESIAACPMPPSSSSCRDDLARRPTSV